jgi:hypothetical protein
MYKLFMIEYFIPLPGFETRLRQWQKGTEGNQIEADVNPDEPYYFCDKAKAPCLLQ